LFLNDELSVGVTGIAGGICASGFTGFCQNGYDPVLFRTGQLVLYIYKAKQAAH
jgi:hypothetical protein